MIADFITDRRKMFVSKIRKGSGDIVQVLNSWNDKKWKTNHAHLSISTPQSHARSTSQVASIFTDDSVVNNICRVEYLITLFAKFYHVILYDGNSLIESLFENTWKIKRFCVIIYLLFQNLLVSSAIKVTITKRTKDCVLQMHGTGCRNNSISSR